MDNECIIDKIKDIAIRVWNGLGEGYSEKRIRTSNGNRI